jgi:RNA polymerase sigma-70 factor (ECF subfamily)
MDERRARFEAQVMPHLDAAHRFARWLTRSSGDAEDLVQEAFLRAFRGFGQLRGGDVKAWLLTIVRNCHATALRQRQRAPTQPLTGEADAVLGAAATPDPVSAAVGADERRLLQRLVTSLPTEQREVLVLRELEEMSYREIAAITAAPIGTVMSRLARARAALRVKYLGEQAGAADAVR